MIVKDSAQDVSNEKVDDDDMWNMYKSFKALFVIHLFYIRGYNFLYCKTLYL